MTNELLKEGLIELSPYKGKDGDENEAFTNTILGYSLANAKAVSPLPRAKADKLYEQFLTRVEALNKSNTSGRLLKYQFLAVIFQIHLL